MKKITYFAVAAIAALSSCSNEEFAGSNNSESGVFTATLENSVASRATLSGTDNKVNWSDGDEVSINGSKYTTTSTTTTGTFTLVDGQTDVSGATSFTAYYPSAIYNGGVPTLPAVQTYDTKTNGISNVPMYATSNTKSLPFKNLCGVLAIKVTSGTVKTIRVISDATPLSGCFDVTNDAAVLKAPYSNQVVLDCGDGVTANNTTFYVAVPAISSANLQITVSDGTPANDKIAQKTGVTIARSKIYAIDFPTSPSAKTEATKYHAWVQFEATGDNAVKWATMNIGATAETGAGCYGKYYRWGSLEEASSSSSYSSSTSDIAKTGEDIAYKTWTATIGGMNWQMPAKTLYDNLVNVTKYYWEGVGDFSTSSYSGYNVYAKKSTEGATYSSTNDPHVFFPAAGFYNPFESKFEDQGKGGDYWSSTPDNTSNAHYLVFYSYGFPYVYQYYRNYGCFAVRAVLR